MNVIANTPAGQLRGSQSNGAIAFKGVPFASAPVGELRWRPPQAAPAWSGVRDALSYAAASYQDDLSALPPSTLTPLLAVDERQAEDCLHLNVWTPALDGRRPVMVWIHGGGFALGAGSQFVYDGSRLCQRDVVVVTINYRMGPFGFVHLAGPTRGAIDASGNEGLLDQIAALKWVRDNIERFGGDPDNVTIFGESAGGMSVMALMAMPQAAGLFHKAIAQSGPGHNFLTPQQASDWLAMPMLQRLGNDPEDADALRRATADELMAALPGFSANISAADPQMRNRWARPVVEGDVLPDWPENALRNGSASGVPLMAGVTRDEIAVLSDPALTDAVLPAMVQGGLPDHVDGQALLENYRQARQARGAPTTPAALLTAISSHRAMWVPTTRVLEAQRPHAPVFHYVFDWISPAGDGMMGALHGVDIAFPFGTHAATPVAGEFFGQGPAADALADAVMSAWSAFAHRGDPSADGFGDWPPYDADTRPTLMIGASAGVAQAPYEAERRAWDGIATEDMRSM